MRSSFGSRVAIDAASLSGPFGSDARSAVSGALQPRNPAGHLACVAERENKNEHGEMS